MDTPTTKKPTGLDAITSTLNYGSTGDQVKALQQYLIGLGYTNVKADGTYGPETEKAVSQFQLDNGLKSDGIFGPQSVGKARAVGATSTAAGKAGSVKAPDDPSNMFNTTTGALNDKFVPQTQEDLDKYYNTYAASHPAFSNNSADALAYASSTGDFSGLVDAQGQPFSAADEAAATEKANAALKPGFDAEKSNDTAGVQSTLEGDQRTYEKGLATDKENFQNDKDTLDKTAADNGVLFSGGRYQKQKKLQDLYTSNDAYNKANEASTIGNTARDYQYAYGGDAAKSPTLSQYYQVGGNNYNANVARGGVSSGGLSSIYNPGAYNYQGTKVNANKANAAVRAAGLLANKGNKLLSTGYNNQF